MPKKKPVARKKATEGRIPVKTDITSVEKETVTRVNRTLSSVENFLAKWDSSKIKPGDMVSQIERIRQFHSELTKWQRNALKTKTKSETDIRQRLKSFVVICRSYS